MKVRTVLFFALLLIASMLLTACQPAAANEPAEAPAAETSASDTQAEETAVEPVEIVFWHQYDSANAEMMAQLVEEFNSANPDIKVTGRCTAQL